MSARAGHTPGPWRYRMHEDGTATVSAPDGCAPAKVWDYPNADANARLIAQAPAMYALLRELSDIAGQAMTSASSHYAPWLKTIHEARALLAAIDQPKGRS